MDLQGNQYNQLVSCMQTSISDAEVEYEERAGTFLAY